VLEWAPALRAARVARAEVHWYEDHGVGRKELKNKRLLDE
jgi:hypothetical protein